MAMVAKAAYRQTHSATQLAWSEYWKLLRAALFYIHQMNWVNRCHDESTINIVKSIIIIIIIIEQ